MLRTHRLKGRYREEDIGPGVTVEDAKQLLRTVTHGTSEHSIIFQPDHMVFHIAVSSLVSPMNDSPDDEW